MLYTRASNSEHSGPDPGRIIVVRKMRRTTCYYNDFAHCTDEAKKEQASCSQPQGSNVSITDVVTPELYAMVSMGGESLQISLALRFVRSKLVFYVLSY